MTCLIDRLSDPEKSPGLLKLRERNKHLRDNEGRVENIMKELEEKRGRKARAQKKRRD